MIHKIRFSGSFVFDKYFNPKAKDKPFSPNYDPELPPTVKIPQLQSEYNNILDSYRNESGKLPFSTSFSTSLFPDTVLGSWQGVSCTFGEQGGQADVVNKADTRMKRWLNEKGLVEEADYTYTPYSTSG